MAKSGRMIVVAGSMVFLGAALIPSVCLAQSTVGFGVLAGASLPLGDSKANELGTGWHLGGLVDLATPSWPVAFRAEVVYDKWGASPNHGYLINGGTGEYHYENNLISGTANVLWSPPMSSTTSLKPYLKGGVGMYRAKSTVVTGNHSGVALSSATTAPTSSTKPGINIGAGISVPVAGLKSGLEVTWNTRFDKDEAHFRKYQTSFIRLSALVHF